LVDEAETSFGRRYKWIAAILAANPKRASAARSQGQSNYPLPEPVLSKPPNSFSRCAANVSQLDSQNTGC
jgi:hypothetical protein